MEFQKGNLKISEVARSLQMDPQTLRVMIQQGLVPYGKAVKLPGSTRYMYLISPLDFYRSTGVVIGGVMDDPAESP